MDHPAPPPSLLGGLALLTLSALLFSVMGVLIRLASDTVNNETIVFVRNVTGCLLLLPWVALHGRQLLATTVFRQHLWRAVVGLTAMYGFFYGIAHLPLSSAMVFTYSSPVFIPLMAWLVLREPLTVRATLAALLGLGGVLMVCRPDAMGTPALMVIGAGSSLLAALAFVTVRSLTRTEPTIRIVWYFSLIAAGISALPLLWAWRPLTPHEWLLTGGAGALATLSQLAMSRAYALAPASRIGPAAYQAIPFAGFWAWLIWGEIPDTWALAGVGLIVLATLLCLPRQRDRSVTGQAPAGNQSGTA